MLVGNHRLQIWLLPGVWNLLAKWLETGPINPFRVREGPGRGNLLLLFARSGGKGAH